MKSTNIEIYNFLNLINRRFGKLYKLTGFCPLPNNFVVTKEKIKERLILSQMKNEEIFPSFAYEEKRKIKKNFKICLKNCKKIKKNQKNMAFSKNFAEKFELYFDFQIELLQMLLKEFGSHTFDEVAAFREVFNLDPVMSDVLPNLFESDLNFDGIFDNSENFEKKYEKNYLEKLQKIEKQTIKKEKKEKEIENNLKNLKNSQKNKENSIKIAKNVDKNAKNIVKIENKKEIQKIKEERKTLKTSNKDKEKK